MTEVLDTTEFLTAEDILNANDLAVETLVIPEWTKNGKPGTLGIRALSAEEFIKFQDILKNEQTKKSSWVRLVALCACDKNGKRIFSDDQMGKLLGKNTKVFLRTQKFLLQINGVGRPDKTWESLKEILTNAGVDPSIIDVVQGKWETTDEVLKND